MEPNLSPIPSSGDVKNDSFFSDSIKDLPLFEKIEHIEKKHANINFIDFSTNTKPYSSNKKVEQTDIEQLQMNLETKITTKISTNHKNKSVLYENNNNINDNYENFESLNVLGNNDNNTNNSKEELTKLGDLSINKNNQKYSKHNLLGKKRNPEKIEVKNKEDIYKEVKKLFNKYNQKYNEENEILPSYKIYEESKGFFDKISTIVQNKIPGCIIYFNKDVIKNIYLIREQKLLTDSNSMEEILEYIRDSMPIIS
jgi:hypothetical protein